jgi:hypothetical protein
MKDSRILAFLLAGALPLGAANVVLHLGGPADLSEKMPEPQSDVLTFVDGSTLHGGLAGMDTAQGLIWTNADAGNPIHFRPAHLDFIRFAGNPTLNLSPTCHVWFVNGDDAYGTLTTLDNDQVGFKSWFGAATLIPRASVRAISLLSSNYSVAYEGPYHEGGWIIRNNTPRSWTFHDGCFAGTGSGTLGRDFGLSNSTTVEFELAWHGAFSLEADIYCDATSGVEFDAGSCLLSFSPRQIWLRQPWNSGGPYAMPEAASREDTGQMHIAIECDRTERTVSVFVNHVLAKTWSNCSVGRGGTGLLFRQPPNFNSLAGAAVNLSRLKICQWQGRPETESLLIATNSDAIRFINHDRAFGAIESIHEGKATFAMSGALLQVPLERVTRLEFAPKPAQPEPVGPWEVRAHFPGGGALSFELDKWDAREITGRSAILGSLALQPGAIRELEFNLDRAKDTAANSDGEEKEFESLDE